MQLPLDGGALIDMAQFEELQLLKELQLKELQRALAYVGAKTRVETTLILIGPEERISQVTKALRRDAAQFSAENDHNPNVLEACPACQGRNKIIEGLRPDVAEGDDWEACKACDGRGFTGRLVRYFQQHPFAEALIVDVVASSRGEVSCPACRGSFNLADRPCWTGLRHMTCGQKLNVTHESSTLTVEP